MKKLLTLSLLACLAGGTILAQKAKKPARVGPMTPIEDVAGLPRILVIGDSISIDYTSLTRAYNRFLLAYCPIVRGGIFESVRGGCGGSFNLSYSPQFASEFRLQETVLRQSAPWSFPSLQYPNSFMLIHHHSLLPRSTKHRLPYNLGRLLFRFRTSHQG